MGGAASSDALSPELREEYEKVKDTMDEAAIRVHLQALADLGTIEKVKESHPNNIAVKVFDKAYYESLDAEGKAALLKCLQSGIQNPDSGMGCYANQPGDYDRFKPFFSKALAEYHGVAKNAKHESDWTLPEGVSYDVETLGLGPLSMRTRVGRNLADFPLPGSMTQADRCAMENKMCEAFNVLIGMKEYGGQYYSITPGHPNFINEEKYQELVKAHIMFKDMAADSYLTAAGIAGDWPHGRGCYVSEDKGFIVWVGEEDHLRIMCMAKSTKIESVFLRLKKALDVVNGIPGLSFAFSADYGNVTSCPTNLGTGMRSSVHIQLPNLTSDGTDAKAKEICKPLGLSVRGLGGEHTPIGADGTVDISPSARFCIKECEIIQRLFDGLKLLMEAEKAIAEKEG